MTDAEILTNVADGVGRITLNRTRAINALTYAMITLITETLQEWRSHSEVSLVVLDGAGDRGFCAGGDIRALWENASAGRNVDSRVFFRDEYRLNALIARYPKPVVALMTGITMGGGIGVAGHASIRVVTDSSRDWPCPRPASDSPPTSAEPGCWAARPAGSVSTWG